MAPGLQALLGHPTLWGKTPESRLLRNRVVQTEWGEVWVPLGIKHWGLSTEDCSEETSVTPKELRSGFSSLCFIFYSFVVETQIERRET